MGELAWVTQLGNLTASGALIVMFGYLLYQMPKHFEAERKSREAIAEAERKSREKVAANVETAARLTTEGHNKAVTAILEAGQKRDQYEREVCERRHRDLLESQEKMHQLQEQTHQLLREVKHEIANLAQIQSNLRAEEQLRRKGGHKP